MTKVSKKAWIEIGIGLAIFVALALVTAFLDLEINKALYSPKSFYGQFFQYTGELPTYLAAPIIGVILLNQGFGKTKRTQKVWKLLFGALTVGGVFFFVMWVYGRFADVDIMYDFWYQLLFTIILSVPLLMLGKRVSKKTMKKLFWFAVFYAIIAIFTNAIIAVMKLIWERERFRVMVGPDLNVATGIYDGYTPWYLPQIGANRSAEYIEFFEARDKALGHSGDAFRSFPSGHTGAAAAIMSLIILPDIMPKTFAGKKKQARWTIAFLYIGLVALSRVVCGAHYLSDVLFGGFIGIGVATLARWIMLNKIKGLNQEPDEDIADIQVLEKEITVEDLEKENIV